MVEFLTRKGADLSIHLYQSQTPLHTAVRRGYIDIVRIIAPRCRSHIDRPDYKSESALAWILKHGDNTTDAATRDIINVLLENDADVNSTQSALLPAENVSIDVIQALIDCKADVNKKHNYMHPLSAAVLSGQCEVA